MQDRDVALGLFLLMSGNGLAQAQENTKDPDEDAQYVNFGYVSVSPRFAVDPRAKNITFKIRNNILLFYKSNRSIDSIEKYRFYNLL